MATNIFLWLDILFFCSFALFVFYLMVFSLASKAKRGKINSSPLNDVKQHRFVVLFPAYKEDAVIGESIMAFLQQDYPRKLYDVVVISDGMQESTTKHLASLGAKVFVVHFQNSSKAASLNHAMDNFSEDCYDIVLIMDADNHVKPDFLNQLNSAYCLGAKAMQAHRTAKNKETSVALLDAISEEINNSIFRRGHVQMGLSSALSGSGMAFDFNWFRENIKKVSSVGEDKELEMWLLLDKIHIDFLNHVLVLDEKVQTKAAFSNQRKRWIAAQYEILGRALKHLPRAIREGNLDFIDKVFQWIMPPRVILLGLVFSISILATFVSWRFALKWYILCGVLATSLWIAIPKELRGRQLRTAIFDIPYLFLQMLLNMFRVKRNSQSFIHTKHGDS